MKRIQRGLLGGLICSFLLGGTASAIPYQVIPDRPADNEWTYLPLQPSDIAGHWSEPLFQWAVQQHIIDGYPDGTLRPDQPISEVEFLKSLYRAFGILLPTQHIPAGSGYSYDWSDGPYGLADMWNHPTAGAGDKRARTQPITRLAAAELITSAQGLHFEGDEAIACLLGQGMANSDARTVAEYGAARTLTRAEAMQWLRQLTLKGMMTIEPRPEERSDPNQLPSMPVAAAERLPDFSATAVTGADFGLYGADRSPLLTYGESKSDAEQQFGIATETNVFDQSAFPLFSAHFDDRGILDDWMIDQDSIEPSLTDTVLQTNKGIILGESALSDVLAAYGTFGYDGVGMANYEYEKMQDGTYKPLVSNRNDAVTKHPSRVYTISFLFDQESLKVRYVYVASIPATRRGFE
ncbi:S-layer homology domain-containing protein [Paenibacillus rhizovicinus]|nr:S-layer homology domain-containing protein [Paenibacillus rhizovicinus]